MKTFNTLLSALGLCAIQQVLGQCEINPLSVRSFEFGGANYEIVLENKNWQTAAACAASRGGKLAEINSQEEQDIIYQQITSAFIDPSATVAMDGGGASYLWLGGNDSASEGNWVWNGNNDSQSSPFWIGTASGSAVDGSFENWGNEPDNWNGQDGLAIAITNWPLGSSSPLGSPGQWNDVFITNQLYFIIEYPPLSLGIQENSDPLFAIWPNPAGGKLNVSLRNDADAIVITDVSGKTVLSETPVPGITVIDISALPAGTYLVRAGADVRKLIKD